MNYIRVKFFDILPEKKEFLIFFLTELGAEGFEERENELDAWFGETKYPAVRVLQLSQEQKIKYSEETVEEINWNQAWEESYEPVVISGKCYVRAPFHPVLGDMEYEIIIEPRMSFGTAHHETTVLMIETMLTLDFSGKQVLDMGCGTGILAILAEKSGASRVLAIDNDEWAVRNANDNLDKNNCRFITVKKGGLEALTGTFDIILANINRNILLDQIPAYGNYMIKSGRLLVSGFYDEDLEAIREKAQEAGFSLSGSGSRNNWVAALFVKK